MKIWLLIIYLSSAHQGGIGTVEFVDKDQCEQAKEKIVEWINQQSWFGSNMGLEAVCMEIEKSEK